LGLCDVAKSSGYVALSLLHFCRVFWYRDSATILLYSPLSRQYRLLTKKV